MRIGVVVSSKVDGGGEAYLRMLYENLAGRGHDIILIGDVPRWPLPSTPSGVTGKWSRRNVLGTVARMPVERHRILRTATSLHREHPFDLFHLQYKREQVLVTSPLARLAPVLWTEHGRFPDSRGTSWLRGLYARSARSVSRIACVSRTVQTDVNTIARASAPKSTVLANAVDLTTFTVPDSIVRAHARRDLGLPEDALVAVTLSRLHEAKGVDLAIGALDFMAPPVTLLVAGDGPDRARLESLARGRPVVFTGHLDDPRVALSAADVFLFLSTPAAREGSPTAMLQAAAFNLPIVATSDAGVTEEVREAGGVVIDRDPRQLANAMSTQPGSASTSRSWAERHGIEPWIAQYERLMRDIARVA